MNDREYNLYIENYLKNDKTKSAIMLTASWGMGKSYYIQNCLVPYLERNGDKKCVVVSLYGLNDTKEISKAIYLELRAKKINTEGEKQEAGRILAKTILKNGLSMVGLDFSVKEEDMEKLYASIDLTGKLIILEDLERSSISIKQVLGYVNNLVEQDGVKVLLIANESEIKETRIITNRNENGEEEKRRVYTTETEEYLKIKEKTVSDTILYLCDYDAAIESILKKFADRNISNCLADRDTRGISIIIKEISNMMMDIKIYNLRSLIFACQKTVDIFGQYTGALNSEFFKHVFLGNVAFSLKLKSNDDLTWSTNTSPNTLGTSKYPLYKFCYNYIKHQELDVAVISAEQEAFLEKKEFERRQIGANTALSILYDFTMQKSVAVELAVEMVCDELRDGIAIPLTQYGKLANYLIAVKSVLEKPEIVEQCKMYMIENLKKATQKDDGVLDRLRFHDSFELWDESQISEYNEFTIKMCAMFRQNIFSHLSNEDPLKYFDRLTALMLDDDRSVRRSRSFMDQVEVDKILMALEKATAEQISAFRRGLQSVYGITNIRDYLPNDRDAIVKLKDGIQKLLECNKGADRVVQLQYSWFVININSILENY